MGENGFTKILVIYQLLVVISSDLWDLHITEVHEELVNSSITHQRALQRGVQSFR